MTPEGGAPSALHPGRMFGSYRIERPLGHGGMASVFLAYDTILHRYVALKIVLEDPARSDASGSRVLREARNAAGLNHPNICTIHEVGQAADTPFIAMEYVDGRALRDHVNDGAMPATDVIRYGRQAADALAYAHEHGVIHRDFKVANAIVDKAGRLKVVDFGLSRRTDPLVADATTIESVVSAGGLAGTPYAMAPEQVRGRPADARTDIWALGVLLYEMATGRRPFAAETTLELYSSILRDAPAPITDAVPAGLKAVIERCLDKDPARRYGSAAEVGAALDAIDVGSHRPWLSPGSAIRRRPALAIVTTAAAMFLLLAFVNRERIRTLWLTGPHVESLAVLPLENLSGDSAQDYFAEGMTEVLSTDLARLGGLKRVTARGSVIRYKGTSKPLAEIARELNVDALITGSVQRSGNRVSITAQLLDPATGDQLWSNRYERDLQDVLAIRNEIVSAIVGEIRTQLSPAERTRLASSRPVHPEAFEAYLQGRFHWFKQTREDYDLAERYFQLALDKDPGYALGYAGLGSVWMMRGDAGFLPASETAPKAREFMRKALDLDDSLADVHVALGNQAAVDLDWTGAERELRSAIEVNPNLADGHFFYADLLLTALNRPDDSKREMQRALELDPLNEFNWSFYGWHLNYLGRYDEAIPIFQRLLPTGPNKASNHLGLWGAYFRKGMYKEALSSAREYFVEAGDGEFAGALGPGSDRTSYVAAMLRTGEAMVARSSQRHVPAIRIARMFAHAGDKDRAFQWLERAFQNHESPLARLRVFWDWTDLHSDPRFRDLLERLHLPA
jgi:serine/threonine-protein kinase